MNKLSMIDAFSTEEEKCHAILSILADPVVLGVLDSLSSQPMRFTGLQKTIVTSSVTLTKRLRTMESLLLICRTEESIDKQSVLYELLPLGEKCLPAVKAVKDSANLVADSLRRSSN